MGIPGMARWLGEVDQSGRGGGGGGGQGSWHCVLQSFLLLWANAVTDAGGRINSVSRHERIIVRLAFISVPSLQVLRGHATGRLWALCAFDTFRSAR